MKKIIYLTPSSFCRGVEKSLKDLDRVREKHSGEDLYCVHAIVHNPGIAQKYIDQGVRFVETIDEITNPNAIVTFSAHGTNRSILDEAKKRFKAAYNLECPLVTKVYKEIDMYAKKGITTFFYIAKEGHQEAKNVIGYIQDSGYTVYHFQQIDQIPEISRDIPFAVLSQTTLNYEHVKSIIMGIQKKYPDAQLPPLTDICKATRERQTVILQHLDQFDALMVLGGKESHNTKELYKLGLHQGKDAFRGETMEEILDTYSEKDLLKHTRRAITGGASTPHADIKKFFDRFIAQGYEPKVATLEEKVGAYV